VEGNDGTLYAAVLQLSAQVAAMKSEVRSDIDKVYLSIKQMAERRDEQYLTTVGNQTVTDRRLDALERRVRPTNGRPEAF
jgi:hypothetical protein